MLNNPEWYGTQYPKWFKWFNVKTKSALRVFDKVKYNELEGYIYDVSKGEALVMMIVGERLIPYSLKVEELTLISNDKGADYESVKNSVISDAWEMNYNFDKRKVEELKLRKRIGSQFRRDYEVVCERVGHIRMSKIHKLETPKLEDPDVYLDQNFSYIAVIR